MGLESNTMNDMNNIPSDEDFARASKFMEERSRNLDQVRDNVVRRFKTKCALCDFYILPQRDVDFRAYVFLMTDQDVDECKSNGINQQIMDYVYAELERADRGKKPEIKVAFEFDSDENVTANFEGNYFLRLR